jgi:hypothetical protein
VSGQDVLACPFFVKVNDMATKTTTKTSSTTRATQLIAGTKKKYPNGSQVLSFGGGDHTVDEVTTKLQSLVDLRTEAENAKATAHTKVATERAQLPALLVFMSAYVAFLKATFGDTPDALVIFGLPPRKQRTPPTADQQAAAVAKREATRQARGTRGPIAKKAVKGNVVGVEVTPLTQPAPAAQTPPAAPAPAPSPAPTAGTGATPAKP